MSVSTPICGCCGAKFAWDAAKAQCKRCGVTAEVLQAGHKAVDRFKRAAGLTYGVSGRTAPRKRAHGRSRGAPKVAGTAPRPKYRRKKVQNG